MKRIIAIVCAAAMLSLTACHKDKEKDNTSSNTPAQPQGEGIYNPGAKIGSITYSDDTPDETWQWEGDQLMAISTDGQTNGTLFDYQNGRVSSVTTEVMGIYADVMLNYNSEKYIQGASVMVSGFEAIGVQVRHNSQKKVDRLTLDIDNTVLNAVLQFLMEMMGDSNSIFPFMSPAPANKVTIDDNSFVADIFWTGNNATRVIINASISLTTTLNELPRELIESQLGEMTDVALALIGDNPLPVELTLCDTIDYTYDNQKNPLKGFLGKVDIAALSANNVESTYNTGGVSITATISLGVMGQYPFSYDYPLELGTKYYEHEYNSNGWPVSITDDEGNTTVYNYLN